ncbi:MAG: ribonuclease HIII [Candidatus Cloacimonetes bacterium]|nr:ribonuclease HIII [Candidatus Cloacimonadota bacterium]HOA29333.1 ribonuclease HIII [Candidatus Cloacimonadota bacterium]
MHKEIENYLAHLYPLLLLRGIEIERQGEISYGWQLRLIRGSESANINIYHSQKRGLSTVVGGTDHTLLKKELISLLMGDDRVQDHQEMHTWHAWIGSDECGKGDYFGPLVVSAFYLKREQVNGLKKLGVCDSKRLRDDQIKRIAAGIYQNFPGQMNCLIIKNPKYNELIASFVQQTLNLNDLLAWSHTKVICELRAGIKDCEGILVDQFSKAQKVKARLTAKDKSLNVVERTGAERDPAVAAASILARYQFMELRKSMDAQYKMTFPLGAGPGVIEAAKQFVKIHGRDSLGAIAKLHFKTTLKV